ncbi:hypothetical protein ABZV31_19740 [Streptomyces sp. NPDC005202]
MSQDDLRSFLDAPDTEGQLLCVAEEVPGAGRRGRGHCAREPT